MHFTFVDIVFAVIVLVFAVMACSKGFIEELFGKVSIIAGVFVSVVFCGRLSPYLQSIIKVNAVCVVLAFIILFVATFLFFKLLQSVISGVTKGEILNSLDRILGFVLGAFEGLFIVCFLLVLLKAQPWFDTSSVTDKSFFWATLSGILEKPVKTLGEIFV